MEYKLSANYDSRNSFYGKATVIENDEKTELKSYNTIVAYIEDDKAVVNGQYNQTTLRHIKEFLKQHGFTAECRKQIEEDYSPTEVNDEKNLKEEKKQKEEESNNIDALMKEKESYRKGYYILLSYFNSINDEEKKKVHKELKEVGL